MRYEVKQNGAGDYAVIKVDGINTRTMAYAMDGARAEEVAAALRLADAVDANARRIQEEIDRQIAAIPSEAPALAAYGRNGGFGPWDGTEERILGPDPHSTPVARLRAVPCRSCAERVAREPSSGPACDRWQLVGAEVGRDHGLMPRDLALMAAAAPQMCAALETMEPYFADAMTTATDRARVASARAALDAARGIGQHVDYRA